jgi:hypothetical protein
MSQRPAAADRLTDPEAVLSRSDLAALGWPRRGIDAIFRGCPVISLPGYSRPLIQVADYHAFIHENMYRGDRVRPTGQAA